MGLMSLVGNSAPDDIMRCDEVRVLLKDVREARQSKMREGLSALNPIHLEVSPRLSHEALQLLATDTRRRYSDAKSIDSGNQRTPTLLPPRPRPSRSSRSRKRAEYRDRETVDRETSRGETES